MHVNDFREDLEPTLAQWRAIGRGLCALAGEPAPTSRAAALELILRLEAEPAERAAAAPAYVEPPAAPAGAGEVRQLAEAAGPADFRTGRGGGLDQRDTRSRTGGRS